MGLKVWLPLNGDLRNLGLLNITGNNSEATISTSGKIGSCYSFNGTTSYLYYPHDKSVWNNKEISIAVWFKFSSATGRTKGHLVDIAADLVLDYYYNATNGLQFGYWRCYSNNGTRTGDTASTSNYFNSNEWHHIVLTCDHSINKIYVDGILQSTFDKSNLYTYNFTPMLSSGYDKIEVGRSAGDSSNFTCGLINDVRIYDHCLSAAEVHEIAQGLVLHYKLDDPYIETPTFIESTINTTAYNGATGKYGYNETANLAKTTGFFQGKNCIKISTITEGQNARPYSYFSNLFTSNGTNAPAYKALSFDYFTTCPTTTWLNIYKLGSGEGTATWKTTNSTGVHSGVYTNSSDAILVTPNEWNHVEVILHGTTNANAEWGYCINGPTHTSNLNYYFLFANIQLEENDHTTGYGANMHKPIITDSSGYGYNGTITGDLIVNKETKRYLSSIKWNSSAPAENSETGICYIQTPLSLINPLHLSFTWWAKPESGYNDVSNSAFCTSSSDTRPTDYNTTAFHHRDSGFDICPSDNTGVKRLSFPYIKNEWHHYAITYDGTTAKAYRDGTLQTTVTVGTNKTLASFSQLFIGYSQAGGVRRKTLGSYSDFRIYCTPLLDTDIKMLYNTNMRIDNLGGVHSFELNEKEGNQITASNLNKDGNVTTFIYDEATNTHTITLPSINSSWGYGISLGNTHKLYIPWNSSYRLTMEVFSSTSGFFNIDYNNNADDMTDMSGNDNDAVNSRLPGTVSIPANIWTRVTFGAINNDETKNPHKLALYDYSHFGMKNQNTDTTITYKIRNIQWYLVNDIYNIEKNGILNSNYFNEALIATKASIRNKEKSIEAIEFIEI